jgi:hypothetical protein
MTREGAKTCQKDHLAIPTFTERHATCLRIVGSGRSFQLDPPNLVPQEMHPLALPSHVDPHKRTQSCIVAGSSKCH